MRIGMVTATYDPAVVNGAVRMVGLYKQYLEALGHEVYIFTLGHGSDAGEDAGIIRSPGIRLGDYGYYFGLGYSRKAQLSLAGMDVVHCHHLFMGLEMAHRYARSPIVYTNHTRYDLYIGAYTPLPQSAADAVMRRLWPRFTDLADVVIAPSESMRQVLIDFGVRGPTLVIENGIDLEPFLRPRRPRSKVDFGLPESAQLLVYVGRLSSEKNVPALLRQFAGASESVSDLHLAIFGQGPQEAELRRLAHELGIDSSVHFHGLVPYSEVGDWLAAADAFVTASTSEVHPLTIIEAMAAGKPIAAVASPGITDMVESGIFGCLALTAESGLAEAMVALTADPERARTMGAAAREAGKRFDIRRTVNETVNLYEELLRTRPDLERDREHGRRSRRTEKWVAGGRVMGEQASDPRRRLGRWGENVAAIHLEAGGLTIVERNWRCRDGEIDLVARDGETVVFVEVKTRRGRDFGAPEEALTPHKAQKLMQLGRQYIVDNALEDENWRIDLVAVELDRSGRLLRCDHIPNAVLGW